MIDEIDAEYNQVETAQALSAKKKSSVAKRSSTGAAERYS